MKARVKTIGKNSQYAIGAELPIIEILEETRSLGRMARVKDSFIDDEIDILERGCCFLSGGMWEFITDEND